MENIDKHHSIVINILFLVFPITLIFGNLFINLNLIVLIIATIFFYKKKIFELKINFLDKIVITFFCYSLIAIIINFFLQKFIGYDFSSKFVIKKTFFFLRFLLFYLILRFLLSKKILKLNWFCSICAICAAFVCLDIFIQFFLGKNILGFKPYSDRHFSGVFQNELIAGGYLQKLAIFSFFLPFVLKSKLFFKVLFKFTIFLFFLYGIILSGNRMPLILFIFTFCVILFLNKKILKYSFIIIILSFFVLNLHHKNNLAFRMNVGNFYIHSKNLITIISTKNILNLQLNDPQHGEALKKPYVAELACFTAIWKRNPIVGGGIRSFRTFTGGCSSHPHNYFLEIISDLGVLGITIILILIFTLIKEIFINKISLLGEKLTVSNSQILPFFLIFICEFFPVRSSGSFFSTNNAVTIFIILAILVSFLNNKQKI